MTFPLVDLQVNGFGGVDFSSPLLTGEQVVEVAERLAEAGTHRELLARHDGIYRRLYEMQLQLQ